MQLQGRFLPTPRKMPDGKRGLSSPSDKQKKNSERKCYIGLTERTLKDRLYKHRNSLRHRSKAYSTVLSRFNDITRLYLLNTQSQITTPVKKIGVKCEFYKNISKYFGFKHLVVILYILIHVKAYNVTILFFMISMVVLT